MGKLSGTIKGTLTSPVSIHAILLPSGKSFSAQTSTNGTFEFPTLPIGSYLVMADDRALATQGYSVKNQTIDLFQSPTTSITMPLVPTQRGPSLQGNIHDAQGNSLPFAWVAIEKAGLTQSNLPDSGNYTLADLPNEAMTVVASAPGYYHVAQVVDPIAHQIDFALTRRPETRSIVWGAGEVVVPPESQVFIDQPQITLEYGWLWGHGGTDRPLIIRVADAEIVLPRGRFALEYLPPNHTSWLYVFEGDATVRQNPNAEPITIRAGEMVALTSESRWTAVPIDPVVMMALRTNDVSPIAPQWEPTLSAQVRDWLAQMGIGAAQLTTLIMYALILPTLAFAPIVVIAAWRKRRLRPTDKT